MILLDTNALLWLFMGNTTLAPSVRRDIEADPSQYFVSIVSLWEVAIKRTIGKLELDMDLPEAIRLAGFANLPLLTKHVSQYETLPLLHRDPFDRMLVAQALTEGVPLLTSDTNLEKYGAKIISAK